MASPLFALAWAALAATFIFPAFLRHGWVRTTTTILAALLVASALLLFELPVLVTMLPFGVAVVAWFMSSLKRHAS